MKFRHILTIAVSMLLILGSGGALHAQCAADSNNSPSTAEKLGFRSGVSGWVCPDDNFDFFELNIPVGADVTGSITFQSPQPSTVIRIYHATTGVRVLNDASTTDSKHAIDHQVTSGSLPAGKYYARVFFWSASAIDHEYSISVNLSIVGADHYPDANEDHTQAMSISFGGTGIEMVGEYDHLDLWKFSINSENEGFGTIELDAVPGELFLLLYDSNSTKLTTEKTKNGKLKYKLANGTTPLPVGEYYIGVFLPNARTDENSYVLSLKTRDQSNVMYIDEIIVADSLDMGALIAYALRPIYARITIDSLYCVEESDVDAMTPADEPYVLVTGMYTAGNPRAWGLGDPQIFGNVDDGDINRFTGQNRVVFDGEVKMNTVVGFAATIMEEDDGYEESGVKDAYMSFIMGMIDIQEEALLAIGGTAALATGSLTSGASAAGLGFLGGGAVGLIASGIALMSMAFDGGEDDYVGGAVIAIPYADLQNWQEEKVKLFDTEIDGGSEGHYYLRWHIEFEKDADRSFSAPFSNWDFVRTGNFFGTSEDEIVTIDQVSYSHDGIATIYNANGNTLQIFHPFFTAYDQVAVGDINNDGLDEVVIASDDNSGVIAAYDRQGNPAGMWYAPVTPYDGLAVGDVTGDAKEEILLARDDDQMVYVYSNTGALLWKMPIVGWHFNGVRTTAPETHHHGFMLGDVMGDSKLEIVFVENNGTLSSRIHIYSGDNRNGIPERDPIRFDSLAGFISSYDAFCLGDMNGDGKKDLIVATDQGDSYNGCKIKIYDLAHAVQLTGRYWPAFTGQDSLIAGDVLGIGRDQIVLATDEDNRIYIAK